MTKVTCVLGVIVNVVPEDSFKLSAKNKADETATISQDKTVWTVHDFDTDANGQISADGITAGKWQGKFNFNINLESDDVPALPEEKVLGDLVVPDANEWKGQVLSNIYVMEVGDTGILEATNDGEDVSDALEITSSNEDVVKVEDKQLEAVGIGQTTITTIYESKSLSAKIKVVELETSAHTHTAGEAIKENEVAATYEKEGSYDEVTYCTDCSKELSRTTKVVPKLLAAGLYDENDNLIKSWDELVELGLNVEKVYEHSTYQSASSGYSVFKKYNLSGKLVFPNTIRRIYNYSFYGCSGLTSVVIPDSVKEIRPCAFASCHNLTSVTIPNSVTSIGERAFGSCSSLTSVTIPDSVTKIYRQAFEGCKSLTSVTIPNSVTKINEDTFAACTSLTSIVIPDSVAEIDENAFYGCTSLTSVVMPNSITGINNNVFKNCTSLESITIPDSVKMIYSNAFYGCTSLKSVTLGNSIAIIFVNAFYNCKSLESVTYRGVTYTDKNALNNKLRIDGVTANWNVWP